MIEDTLSQELARLAELKAFVKFFIKTFANMLEQQRDEGGFYSKEIKHTYNSPFSEQSKLTALLHQFNEYQISCRAERIAAAEYFRTNLIKPLEKLKAEIKSKMSQLETLESMNSKEQRRDIESLSHLSKQLNDSLVAYKASPSTPPKHDPWMLNKQIQVLIKEVDRRHVSRSSTLEHTSRDFLIFQEQLINTFKMTLLRLSETKTSPPHVALLLGKEILPVLEQLDAAHENALFEKARIHPQSTREIPRFEHGTNDRLVCSVRESVIKRQKAITNAWTSAFGILTASGFFYVYDDAAEAASAGTPLSSYWLFGGITGNGKVDDEFIILEQKSKKGHSFKGANANDASEWIDAIRQFLGGNGPRGYSAATSHPVDAEERGEEVKTINEQEASEATGEKHAEDLQTTPPRQEQKNGEGTAKKPKRSFTLFRQKIKV